MKLAPNFHINEFASRDGAEMSCEIKINLKELALNLQVLRDYLGKPITINSGYRSPAYNATIPSAARNSQHIYGKAADIRVGGMTPTELYDVIEELIADKRMKNGGMSKYRTFLHYDVRDTPARW